MNFGTMVQEILDDLHVMADEPTIWRKICDSVAFHRENRLWFSERQFKFTLTAGRSEYALGDGFGLPADLVEIATPYLWLWLNGSEASQQSVERATPAEMDCYRASDSSDSDPEYWDVDHKRLRLWPAPNSNTDVLTGRYVSDIGVPSFTWNGTAYDFKTAAGAPLTTSFTNDWFRQDGAARIVKARATYLVSLSLRDPESETFLGRWLEEKAKIEDESDARSGGGLRLIGQLW